MSTGNPPVVDGSTPSLTGKVFTKLLALFFLVLVFHTVVMEIVFRRLVGHMGGVTLPRLGREALWSGIIALLVALPVAAWVAMGVTRRLQRVVTFARQIADGDLTARLDQSGGDE